MTLRPVIGEPQESRVEAVNRDPGPIAKGAQLLAVAEHAMRHRCVKSNARGGFVPVSDGQQGGGCDHASHLQVNLPCRQRLYDRFANADRSGSSTVMDMKEILKRIDQRRKAMGLNDKALSLSADMSEDGVRNWRRRLKNGENFGVNASSLQKVARALGVTEAWLVHGDDQDDAKVFPGKEQRLEAAREALAASRSDFRHIDVYDIEASAGDGAIVSSEQPLYDLAFRREWLEGMTRAADAELAVIRAKGESMSPTLTDGDMLLVDTTKKNINYDGLYILRYDDVLRVKRIDLNPSTRRYRVKSDNPLYDTFEVEAADLDVVGRVIWIGRKV